MEMPVGDLHGAKADISLKDGSTTGFEMVRLGTLQELETVKSALAVEQGKVKDRDATIRSLKADAETSREAAKTTSAAYEQSKADVQTLMGELATVKADYEAARDLGTEMQRQRDNLSSELDNRMDAEKALREAEATIEERDKQVADMGADIAKLKIDLLNDAGVMSEVLDALCKKLAGE